MYPLIMTLTTRLGLSGKDARQLRASMESATTHEAVDQTLELASNLIKGYGVESIRGVNTGSACGYYRDTVALYANTGGTYKTTLLYDCIDERFHVTTMGDWVDYLERKKVEVY